MFGKCSGKCQEYASVVYEDLAKVCILGELPGGLAGQGQTRVLINKVRRKAKSRPGGSITIQVLTFRWFRLIPAFDSCRARLPVSSVPVSEEVKISSL